MTHAESAVRDSSFRPSELAALLQAIPPARRGALLQSAVSFRPAPSLEHSFAVGPIRATFADYWEARFGRPIPVEGLRAVLDPPVAIGTVLEFNTLILMRDVDEIEGALNQLATHLQARLREFDSSTQLSLFEVPAEPVGRSEHKKSPVGRTVPSLHKLVEQGRRFPTIYADPPWPYENEASRAAAVNHYPTMPIDDICAEPVHHLAEDNAHLHLWTTNAFLREALDVIDAWGFRFKSCLIWIKDEIGMGNYWRISHEFLLLGVRGQLTFRDRTMRSWIQAHRTRHSRKPGIVRTLVESVSPGPYLELYGREELPNSAWTVYGNQVESRLF
jgi:N6-adenosine-specific RNA methylase IME4